MAKQVDLKTVNFILNLILKKNKIKSTLKKILEVFLIPFFSSIVFAVVECKKGKQSL